MKFKAIDPWRVASRLVLVLVALLSLSGWQSRSWGDATPADLNIPAGNVMTGTGYFTTTGTGDGNVDTLSVQSASSVHPTGWQRLQGQRDSYCDLLSPPVPATNPIAVATLYNRWAGDSLYTVSGTFVGGSGGAAGAAFTWTASYNNGGPRVVLTMQNYYVAYGPDGGEVDVSIADGDPGVSYTVTLSVANEGTDTGSVDFSPTTVTVTGGASQPVSLTGENTGTTTIRGDGEAPTGSTQPASSTTKANVTDEMVTLTLDGTPHQQNRVPGGYVIVNANNDNGGQVNNGIPVTRDFTLTNPQPFDDPDLIPLTITVNNANLGDFVMLAEADVANAGAQIRIWDSRKKNNRYSLPKNFSVQTDLHGANGSVTVYVEGVHEGFAQAEIQLKATLQNAGKSDVLNLTVGPVLTALNVTSGQGTLPDLLNDNQFGWGIDSRANGNGQKAQYFHCTVICPPNLPGHIDFVQTMSFTNNGAGGQAGKGAIMQNGAGFVYDFNAPNNRAAVNDADPPNTAPVYVNHPNPNANGFTLTDDDSPFLVLDWTPLIPQSPGSVGNVLPVNNGDQTAVDVTFNATDYAIWTFPAAPPKKTTYYFLANTTWATRCQGTVKNNGANNYTFNKGANDANNGNANFTRSNTPATALGPTTTGIAGIGWR